MPSSDTYFQPGQSGNPGGRPRRHLITESMRKLIEAGELFHPLTGKPIKFAEGRQVAEVLAAVFIFQAIKGSFPHGKEILDRTEGKVKDAEPEDQLDAVAAVRKAQEI